GLTCGAGPCEFLAVNTGEIGAINSVQPQFENVGLQDTFHASNRLDLNFGLRYENFGYNMRSSNTLGNQLLVNDYNASHCIAGTAITKAPCAPGSTPTALNARSTDLAYQVWSPRFGATYKLNPENVFRFSYGRFSQPAETSAVQATNFQAGVPSTGFYSNFGFAGFSRNVVPEISYNTDFSWEHQFKGSDTSFSITPFLRKTQNEFIAILVDPKTNFVANVNGLNRNVSGFEFALRKGDFNRNGFSGLVSYTYTHATAKYKVFPTGGSFVAQANQLIQQYNGYTSFCAKSPTNSLCGPTVSGAAAAPCYTAAGTADPACAAGSIVNPYWNSKPGSMFDPNASYVPFNQNIGPGASGVATSYVVPDVLAVVLNYKRNRWSFTPSFQVQAGAKYGSPLVAQGVAPDSCAALTTAIAANDPRYIYGLPTGSAAASGYDAASCATAISIPNPVTKQFDGIGAFTQPSVLITNLAIGYEISPKATIRLTAANILDRCFGGTPAAWNIPTYGCSYGQQGTYVGNFYNPGDKIQLGVAQPYSPIVAGALQSTNASNTPPFAMFLDFSLSL
ncbi:MAG: TonB-dependent receptor domain-containing protein, partial [Vulcanimicrobiaceae bacterium]